MMGWRSASSPATSSPTTTRSRQVPPAILTEIEGLFVEVLKIARETGLLKLGTVALEGSAVRCPMSIQGRLRSS
jgi:hypothetical protein